MGWEETLDHVNRALGRGSPEAGDLPPPFATVKVTERARIDLSLPAAERWTQAAAAKPGALEALIGSAEHLIAGFGRVAFSGYRILSTLAYPFYRLFGTYIDEGLAIADAAGQPRVATTVLQRLYTLGYAAPGCSTCVIEHVASGRKLHFRSLDWPMVRAMRASAQIHEFYARPDDTQPQYRSAGMYGVLGLLSAAKPGFAVSVNHAPLRLAASFHPDPLLLLRRVFDAADITTYRQAVEALSGKNRRIGVPGAPVFYVVSGSGKGEACVVEWGGVREGCRVLDIEQGNASVDPGYRLLLQTNHYSNVPGTESPFLKHNNPENLHASSACLQYVSTLQDSSMARRRALRTGLNTFLAIAGRLPTVAEIAAIYAKPPLFNYESAQWVSLDPASGELQMWVRGDASLKSVSREAMQRCFAA